MSEAHWRCSCQMLFIHRASRTSERDAVSEWPGLRRREMMTRHFTVSLDISFQIKSISNTVPFPYYWIDIWNSHSSTIKTGMCSDPLCFWPDGWWLLWDGTRGASALWQQPWTPPWPRYNGVNLDSVEARPALLAMTLCHFNYRLTLCLCPETIAVFAECYFEI